MSERTILRTELRWGAIVLAVLSTMMVTMIATGVTLAIHPPSNVETIDPATLHLKGEFIERNLGTTVAEDGTITARVVATQFAFVPQCIPVPAGRPVTIRLASPDVIHGILVTGTNVNTMVVPGFVSQLHTVFTRAGDHLMPCHEFCGLGHSQMWATVRVLPPGEWPEKPGKVTCAAQ